MVESLKKCEEAEIIAYLRISINHAHTVMFFSILLFPYYLNIHVYNIWRCVPIHTQMLYIFSHSHFSYLDIDDCTILVTFSMLVVI